MAALRDRIGLLIRSEQSIYEVLYEDKTERYTKTLCQVYGEHNYVCLKTQRHIIDVFLCARQGKIGTETLGTNKENLGLYTIIFSTFLLAEKKYPKNK